MVVQVDETVVLRKGKTVVALETNATLITADWETFDAIAEKNGTTSLIESTTSMEVNKTEHRIQPREIAATNDKETTVATTCPRLPVFGKAYNSSGQSEPRPDNIRNTHIVFIGDSVSRYMYVDLVHLFHTGYYVRNSDFPSVLWERDFGSYNALFEYTDRYFSGHHTCDCYRRWGTMDGTSYDNRYWRDECRNNTLTFVGKFGTHAFQGHFNGSTVYADRPASLGLRRRPPPPLWRPASSWSRVITDHVQHLQPKPKYVYFNAGIWVPSDLNRTQFDDFVNTIRQAGMVPIFRTTTQMRVYPGGRPPNPCPNEFDLDVCGSTVGNYSVQGDYLCHNMTWTQGLVATGNASYHDHCHFRPHVNAIFNEQLLELIAEYESQEKN